MDELKSQISAISANLSSITERLNRIETNQDGDRVSQDPSAVVDEPADRDTDIQAAFLSIKSALATLRVPNSLSVPTDKTGVKKNDQSQHSLITKVAKYSETIVKLLQAPGLTDQQRLSDILTTVTALICFLQEESAALVVQGTFDEGVAKFFRSLQRTNNFNSESLDNLRAAASIAAVYRPSQGQRGAGYHRGSSGGSYRGQASFRGFRRRGFGRGQGSNTSSASNNQEDGQ